MKRFLYFIILVLAVSFSGCLDSDEDTFNSSEQFQEDIRVIDQYLDANGITAQVDDASLIRYVVNDPGDGFQYAGVGDSLTISYTGKVLSTESTFETVENTKRSLGSWLAGVLAGVSFIQEGGSVTAYVPSFYGYGNSQVSDVPANSPLILEIEFHKLHASRLFDEVDAINDSLAIWQIDAETHPTGIRYTIDQGTGDFPAFNSNITFNYDVRLLGSLDSVDAGESITFNLLDLIAAWQIMIPELREGGSLTMYVPASFAYGTQGQGNIPPNANLEFDIDLISTN